LIESGLSFFGFDSRAAVQTKISYRKPNTIANCASRYAVRYRPLESPGGGMYPSGDRMVYASIKPVEQSHRFGFDVLRGACFDDMPAYPAICTPVTEAEERR
jgi:hypothetical protein